MNSFLDRSPLLKKNFFLSIFQGFCLKASEDFFDRTLPSILAVIVKRLCTVFLR